MVKALLNQFSPSTEVMLLTTARLCWSLTCLCITFSLCLSYYLQFVSLFYLQFVSSYYLQFVSSYYLKFVSLYYLEFDFEEMFYNGKCFTFNVRTFQSLLKVVFTLVFTRLRLFGDLRKYLLSWIWVKSWCICCVSPSPFIV